MLTLLVTLLVVATPPSDTDTTETLMRAARYDRNFEARTPQGFRLGVAFDAGVPESTKAAERFAATARLLQASGSELAPAWVELVELEDGLQLYRWLKEHHVSALYVPEALHSSVPAIVSASEAAGVFTIAGSPADVELGLVVGLRADDDSKKLVVNMGAAERCGVDFDAAVRQIAERVGDAPAGDDRDALRQALARYIEAIETSDLDALRSVWPALDGEDEKRIVASFEMARSHEVAFALLHVERSGEKASARVRRVDRLVTRDGKTITAGTVVEFSFSKLGEGAWQIDSMASARPLS